MDYTQKEITIENLEEMIIKYVDYYNSDNGKWTAKLARTRLEQILLTPGFFGVGLFNDLELVGFAIGWYKQFDDIKLYYLEEVLVFKDYQNKGLGSKLLEVLEEHVRKENAAKICLSTTHKKNHQRFYQRLGYEKSDFLIPMSKKL